MSANPGGPIIPLYKLQTHIRMGSTVILGTDTKKYLAENYDHTLDHGLVSVNLKGTVKENGRPPRERAVRWSVKYGSITFNQFSSKARFNHLYGKYPDYNRGQMNTENIFGALDSVSQTPGQEQSFPWNRANQNNTVTAWNIVFNPTDKTILLKTHRNEKLREFRLSDFDFGKESEYLIMDINDGESGNARELFELYVIEKNLDIIQKTAPTIQFPQTEQDNLANLVDSLYRNREMKLG